MLTNVYKVFDEIKPIFEDERSILVFISHDQLLQLKYLAKTEPHTVIHDGGSETETCLLQINRDRKMVAFMTGINDASITSKIDETCNHKDSTDITPSIYFEIVNSTLRHQFFPIQNVYQSWTYLSDME